MSSNVKDKIKKIKKSLSLTGVLMFSQFAHGNALPNELSSGDIKKENIEVTTKTNNVLGSCDVNSSYAEVQSALDNACNKNLLTLEIKDGFSDGEQRYLDKDGNIIVWRISDKILDVLSPENQIIEETLKLKDWEKPSFEINDNGLKISSYINAYNTQTGNLVSRSADFERNGINGYLNQNFDEQGICEEIEFSYSKNGNDITYTERRINPSSHIRENNFLVTITQEKDGMLVSSHVSDGDDYGRLTKFDENERITSISFDKDQKEFVSFTYNNDKLASVTYKKDEKINKISLNNSDNYSATDYAACFGFARLIKEDTSKITSDNINKRVIQSYIRNKETPQEDSPFYNGVKTTLQNALKIVNQQKAQINR